VIRTWLLNLRWIGRALRMTILSACALIAVGWAALAVLSYVRTDIFGLTDGFNGIGLFSDRGVVEMGWLWHPPLDPEDSEQRWELTWDADDAGVLGESLRGLKRLWQFGLELTLAESGDIDSVSAVFPHWFAAAVFGFWPAIRVWRWKRRRRRFRAGCCDACGYDLRASRGRCPECGKEIPSSDPCFE
jgi:hypothetical protein